VSGGRTTDLLQRCIDEIASMREGWEFEAKRALGRDGRGKVPKDFWPSYSALANTSGGVILLGGAERADGLLDLVGFPNIEEVEQDLWSTLGNPQKVSVDLLSRHDVRRFEVAQGRWVLVIRVPKASRNDLPVYINGNMSTGTYIRRNSGDHRAGAALLRRLIADSLADNDATLVTTIGLDALHPETVEKYRDTLRAKRPDHPFLSSSQPTFLQQIGAAGTRGADEPIRPTRAGLWMFGIERALLSQNPAWYLSFKRLPAYDTDERRWTDRVHPDGTWPPNLFEFYLRAQPKLVQDVPVPFALDRDLFRIDETRVHAALREALVNCLVHADHGGNTGIRVEAGPQGFSFRNPGLLLISEDRLWEGGYSVPRNPTLHKLFALIQLGEREGSGGRVMWQAWSRQRWGEPQIRQDSELWETRLTLSRESLLSERALAALKHRFGERYVTLPRLERELLAIVEVEREVDHARLIEATGGHSRDVTLAIQRLRKGDLLQSAGRGKSMTYLPAESSTDSSPSSMDNLPSSTDSSPSSTDSSPSSTDNSSSSMDSLPSSTDNPPSSTDKNRESYEKAIPSMDRAGESHVRNQSSTDSGQGSQDSGQSSTDSANTPAPGSGVATRTAADATPAPESPQASTPTASPLTDAMIDALRRSPLISKVASVRRSATSEVEDAVVHLCSVRPMTVEDLATILNRTKGTLRDAYLPRLIRDGRLIPTSDTPTDPRRAYRTAETP